MESDSVGRGYDYERLETILERKAGRPVPIEEAIQAGDWLMDYYSILLDSHIKDKQQMESIDRALSGEIISLAHARKGGKRKFQTAMYIETDAGDFILDADFEPLVVEYHKEVTKDERYAADWRGWEQI